MASAGGDDTEEIQEETGAKVSFTERDTDKEGDGERTVFIRGDSESAQKAEIMIRQFLADMPTVVSEEVRVPVYCLGRLIGRGGDTIRSMSRNSRCKILIDRSQDNLGPEVPRVVTITGTRQDIQVAKMMIEDVLAAEEEFRAKMAVKGANREQRKGGHKTAEEGKERQPLESREAEKPEGSWDAGDRRRPQIPGAEPVREFMEVFVSAVEHAGHFWLQVVNQDALSLDSMTDDMSAFYSDSETSERYKLTEVHPGDMVAAPFSEDNMWYRARVEGLVEGKVDLYYFDFGDNGLTPLESLRELKPEYLILPVQAIECKLANVKPAGAEWSEASIDAFERLSHCAEWKILSARTVGYVPLGSQQMPCVQLIDNAAMPPVNVAEEMVAQGLAVWEDPPSSPSPPSEATPSASADTVRPQLVPDPRPS